MVLGKVLDMVLGMVLGNIALERMVVGMGRSMGCDRSSSLLV
jgi:hypothetical protein